MRDTHRMTQASMSAWQTQHSRVLSRPWVPGVAALEALLATGAVAVFDIPWFFLLWPLALVVKALVVEPTQAAEAIEWARSNAPLSDHGMSYRLNRPTTILLLLVGAALAGYFVGDAL